MPAMQETLGLIPGLRRSLAEGKGSPLQYSRASLVAQRVKNMPTMWETWVRPRVRWQPTPVFLPGESPWAKEPGGLQCMGLQKVEHGQANTAPRMSRVSP